MLRYVSVVRSERGQSVTTNEIDYWIRQAKRRTESGHETVVILVPYGGYQTIPQEMAEKKYKNMIVYPKPIEKLNVPVVTLGEYVQKTYDMGMN